MYMDGLTYYTLAYPLATLCPKKFICLLVAGFGTYVFGVNMK